MRRRQGDKPKKGLTRELIFFCVLKLPSYASLVELTAKISQAQKDTDKERKKNQGRKEGRKEGKRRKKGKGKERRKEGRKKKVNKKKRQGDKETN